MADILTFKKKKPSEKYKGGTLCRNGHHNWAIDKQKAFDVKEGKLVTVFVCARCDKKKRKLT